MTKDALRRFRAVVTDEEVAVLYSLLARMRKGYSSGSPAKTKSGRCNAAIALAVRKGDHVEADRLRWLHYPEKMRARQLAAQLGERKL